MNNLLSEEEIIYIATDCSGKNFFPDVTAILFQWHLHVARVLLCFQTGTSQQNCPPFFFVSVLLILKHMNYSQRIPYIFKTFLLNKTAYLIPSTLDYP